MDRAGTVLFKLNKEALEKRMEELTANYPGAFWVLCDRTGKSLDGGNQEAFWNTAGAERETFEEYRYEPFRMEQAGGTIGLTGSFCQWIYRYFWESRKTMP